MRARVATALVAALGCALAVQAVPAAAAGLPFRLPAWAPPQLRAMVRSRTQPSHRHSRFLATFQLEGPHGYEVALLGADGKVVLAVARQGTLALTAYAAPGTVTRRELRADFGSFGEVRMHFRPAPSRSHSSREVECHRHHTRVTRQGLYVGSLSFHGEGEYLTLDRHRARGKVVSFGGLCAGHGPAGALLQSSRPHKPRDRGPEPRFLLAGWRHDVNAAVFVGLELFGINLFLADSEQNDGKVAVVRLALAIGDKPRAFTLDNALTRATLTPPAPFHGTGVYTAAPDGTKAWEGPLTVNFPGAPRFALTGPEFEPELEAGFAHSLGG